MKTLKAIHSALRTSPWFSLAGLNLLLILPGWLERTATAEGFLTFAYARQIFTLVWISLDLLVLIYLLFLTRKFLYRRRVFRGAVVFYELLFAFQIYAAVITALFRRENVLYNDLFIMVDGLYLLLDLAPATWLLTLFMAGALGYLLVKLIPRWFRRIAEFVRSAGPPRRVHRVAGIGLVALLLLHLDWGLQKPDSFVQIATLRVAENFHRSAEYYESVHTTDLAQIDSLYNRYAIAPLPTRPDVYFVMLESYGKVLLDNPNLRRTFIPGLERFGAELDSLGWSAATAYSKSPVSGGGSWLANATVLSGVKIANEPLYHRFVTEGRPNMVQFFESHGYGTYQLGPANRARPGIPMVNDFNFERPIGSADLHYTGQEYGWGRIPDQYSLFYTADHILDTTGRPVFLHFTTLATHVTWSDESIPPLMEDYTSFNADPGRQEPGKPKVDFFRNLPARLLGSLLQPYKPENFPVLINYDLEVLARFLATRVDSPAVMVVLGDHQPSLITSRSDGFYTLCHVLSTDPALTGFLQFRGFTGGLLPDNALTPLSHEDIYPLLAEGLLSVYGTPGDTW